MSDRGEDYWRLQRAGLRFSRAQRIEEALFRVAFTLQQAEALAVLQMLDGGEDLPDVLTAYRAWKAKNSGSG